MRQKKPMSLYLPDTVDAWIQSEAGKQRMSKSDFVYALLTKGVQAETIDASVARLEAAVERGGITRELLAQNLATQYMVEQVAVRPKPGAADHGSSAYGAIIQTNCPLAEVLT